ncbi:hypothetical protein [Sphingomonas xinjiangensis]|uniref:Uncharacterized protein n=1 Tax=Sphingomonas xinjiangensis TaxID=643568 RepID=A0A840YQ26_9SPHN|nr:hypothetical protein [Sphingomonas xinjiangensis]MBB5710721.1 hypothetical protein [Sphingomonas xinjiangensis]
MAALIAAAPVLTITGAHVLAGRERAQADRLETALAPRVARQVASEQARDLLAPLVNSPTLAATLDTLARGLPKDASIVRAERGGDGALRLELRTPDPDALRGALRRVPTLAVLREIGQQRSDAAMIVSYRGQTE